MVGRALLRAAIGVLLLLSAVYGGDYLWLRLRLLLHRNPYSILTVQPFYAVPNKNAKGEQYFFLDPHTQTCVRSLFPHLGYSPCWYLNRHKQRRISV